MELIDHRLTILRYRGGLVETELRSMPIAESWIAPIAENHWPVDLLRQWVRRATLVWLSRGFRAPSLCWLLVCENKDGQIVLRIRPVMSFNTTVCGLDGSGRVKVVSRVLSEGHPLGGGQLVSRLIRRDELLQSGPGVAELLRRFEEESPLP